MKVRTSGRLIGESIKALGAVPVSNVTVRGTAEALIRGVVDATVNDWLAMSTLKLARITKYHVDVPVGAFVVFFPMNRKTWSSLTPEVQARLASAGGEAFARLWGGAYDRGSARSLAAAKRAGDHQIHVEGAEKAKWMKRLEAVIASWKENHPNGATLYESYLEELKAVRAKN